MKSHAGVPNMQRLIIAILLSWFVVLQAVASDKKGIGLADLHAADRVAALNVAWYYTWSPNQIEGAPRDKFVPMIWGGHRFQEQASALRARGKVPVLLAINEPDGVKQANMSVDEVARLWPELSVLAEKIGSPATVNPTGPWAERFHQLKQQRGLKVDLMAIHLYGPPDPAKFLNRVDEVYRKFGMPIWITEFAVADWSAMQSGVNRYSQEQVLEFMKQVLPELEKRHFVVRYAWFGAGKGGGEPLSASQLFDRDGKLTALGRYYAEFGNVAAAKSTAAVATKESTDWQNRFDKVDLDRSGGLSRAELAKDSSSQFQSMKKQFQSMDVNDDGQVTPREYGGFIQKQRDAWLASFKKADLNNSGGLSRVELDKTKPDQFSALKKHFDAMDGNKDGQISVEERDGFKPPAKSPGGNGPAWQAAFKKADLNDSGGLSRNELEKTPSDQFVDMKQAFERIDSSQDGQVSQVEYQAYLDGAAADEEEEEKGLLPILRYLFQ